MIKINYIKIRQFHDILIATCNQNGLLRLSNGVQEILAFNANYTHTVRKSLGVEAGFILYFIEQEETVKRELNNKESLLIKYIFKAEVYND